VGADVTADQDDGRGRREYEVVQGDDERHDPAREGLEHLQTAALEMIAAARSMLDACEELLDDPRAGEALASVVGSVSKVFGDITRFAVPNREPRDDSNVHHVQRIKIS